MVDEDLASKIIEEARQYRKDEQLHAMSLAELRFQRTVLLEAYLGKDTTATYLHNLVGLMT